MKNRKIKFDGKLEWLKDEKVKSRCKYITVLFENYTDYNGINIRSIRYGHFLKKMAFSEHYKIIAVKEPEQCYDGGNLYEEPIENYGSIFDIFGNEYKVYQQRSGRWHKEYFIIDPDSELHQDGWWFNRIEDYDDPEDFIKDINRSWS